MIRKLIQKTKLGWYSFLLKKEAREKHPAQVYFELLKKDFDANDYLEYDKEKILKTTYDQLTDFFGCHEGREMYCRKNFWRKEWGADPVKEPLLFHLDLQRIYEKVFRA